MEDQILDAVVDLWREASQLKDEADELESTARDRRYQSEDKLDEADEKWKPLIAAHPEWQAPLEEGVDPRTIEINVDVTVNDQNLVMFPQSDD